jgi:hypothetical protein
MDRVAKRFDRPARSERSHYDSLDAVVGIYLCAYSALAGCFFFGLYEFMQPARYANSGMAAYRPAPAIPIAFVQQFRAKNQPEAGLLEAFASAAEPGPETVGQTTPEQEKPTVSKQRARSAQHGERRRLIMNYSVQPSSGGYRSYRSTVDY